MSGVSSRILRFRPFVRNRRTRKCVTQPPSGTPTRTVAWGQCYGSLLSTIFNNFFAKNSVFLGKNWCVRLFCLNGCNLRQNSYFSPFLAKILLKSHNNICLWGQLHATVSAEYKFLIIFFPTKTNSNHLQIDSWGQFYNILSPVPAPGFMFDP
jgi:hypothetical protein